MRLKLGVAGVPTASAVAAALYRKKLAELRARISDTLQELRSYSANRSDFLMGTREWVISEPYNIPQEILSKLGLRDWLSWPNAPRRVSGAQDLRDMIEE